MFDSPCAWRPFVQAEFWFAWLSPLVPPSLAGMDTQWIHRLTDERPGLSFLVEYSRAIRLVSGLCALGSVRARRDAMTRWADDNFRVNIMADPSVRAFLTFLDEFSSGELPMVFEVLRRHLFPDAPTPCLFRAAQLDPDSHTESSAGIPCGQGKLELLGPWQSVAADVPTARSGFSQSSTFKPGTRSAAETVYNNGNVQRFDAVSHVDVDPEVIEDANASGHEPTDDVLLPDATVVVKMGESSPADRTELKGNLSMVCQSLGTILDTSDSESAKSPLHQRLPSVPLAQRTPSQQSDVVSCQSDPVETGVRQPVDISPTWTWTQLPLQANDNHHGSELHQGAPVRMPPELLAGLGPDLNPAALVTMNRHSELAELGSFSGVTLIDLTTKVRLQAPAVPPLVTARAYVLRTRGCPSCFCVCQGPECLSCNSPTSKFSLPSAPDFSYRNVAGEIFDRYRSHSEFALQFTGPTTIHFRVYGTPCPGLLECVSSEGRQVWVLLRSWYDQVIVPGIGDEYCVFQGFCRGSVGNTPIFSPSFPSWSIAFVRRPSWDTPPRTLEMFAGIGGWGQAIKALYNQDHPIFSVEIDQQVATALSLSTRRVLLSSDQFFDELACEDAVLVADILDCRWWVTTLSNPFTGLGWSTPCQPWSQAISELRTEYVTGYSELKDILSNSPMARRLAEAAP